MRQLNSQLNHDPLLSIMWKQLDWFGNIGTTMRKEFGSFLDNTSYIILEDLINKAWRKVILDGTNRA